VTDTNDYKALFLADAPLIDTRAPVEFIRGSFPEAQSLPLMNDSERAEVGTCYKQQGQQAAIELGHRLVTGQVKQKRVEAWRTFAKQNPHGYLFCFRGGLRSQICQQWLADAGCQYPRISGGYKAMRRYLLSTLEEAPKTHRLLILGGHTGSAKTKLLSHIPHSADLEGMAHHRGSAFGKRMGGQPSQINFEHQLAIALLKHTHHHPNTPLVLEDESHLIGRMCIPLALHAAMTKAPLVLVETTLEERIDHSFNNYILQNLQDCQQTLGAQAGFEHFATELQQSLKNIQRRLGDTRFSALNTQLETALLKHREGDNREHKVWIEVLLRDYYDPMYNYQIKQKQDRVIFRGRPQQVLQFLQEQGA